jgi:hypothetical protein
MRKTVPSVVQGPAAGVDGRRRTGRRLTGPPLVMVRRPARWHTRENGCAMSLFSDPSLLNGLGEALVILGLAGQVSLFFFPEGRRILERSLGVLFTLVVIGGVVLTWRAEKLQDADRDLTPAQQATLSKAISQFPTVKYEVVASRADKEAHALALKIADAVKAGSGAVPPFHETIIAPPMGVVLVMRAKDTDLGRHFVDTVGRVLMAARIAVISDHAPDLDDNTVRIVVGGKP